MKVGWCVAPSFLQVSLVNCSSNVILLRLQKEVLFESFSKLTLPLTSKFFLYLDSKGRWGWGFFITYRLLWAENRRSENVENLQSPM
jgi:hypothetical protein